MPNPDRPTSARRLTRYETDALRSAAQNHMWLNAFACIRPSDELKRQIGDYVLSKLADREALIQSDDQGSKLLKALNQKEVVIRFNKS